ncbi:MAG TPA: phosphatase PAP2 family protein [Burkholderiales bacterium]|nr:phosphatase PAP2 family protein [Burkholderiales bacterium]
MRGFGGALAAFLTVGIMVAIAAVGIFAGIAEAVEEGFTQPFDESVLRWFESTRAPWLDRIMLELTTLGSGVVLILLVLITSVVLWQTQHKWSVFLLLLGTIGGKLLNTALKLAYNRPRPTIVEAVTDAYSPSFPSGHAMSAMVVYSCVAYLVGRLEPARGLRYTVWIFAALLILAIGISRMYLGVHYPSDVLAGFAGGLAWLGFVIAGMQALQHFARRRPETLREEKDLNQ